MRLQDLQSTDQVSLSHTIDAQTTSLGYYYLPGLVPKPARATHATWHITTCSVDRGFEPLAFENWKLLVFCRAVCSETRRPVFCFWCNGLGETSWRDGREGPVFCEMQEQTLPLSHSFWFWNIKKGNCQTMLKLHLRPTQLPVLHIPALPGFGFSAPCRTSCKDRDSGLTYKNDQ